MSAPLHSWNVTPREAIAIQQSLRTRVLHTPLEREPLTIAGADISFNRFSETIYAGIVVLRLADLQIVDQAGLRTTATFPYVPGLLSFREAPALLQVWEQLQVKPDVLMMDGQGIAHPRRLGIGCHIGLWLDLPTFGCAKSILVGRHGTLDEAAGSQAALIDRGETVGIAVRTKRRVAPVYISAGHRITQPEAVALALRTVTKYRIPEPTRQAHLLVNRLRIANAEAASDDGLAND